MQSLVRLWQKAISGAPDLSAGILTPKMPGRIVFLVLWGYFFLQLLNVYYIRPHSTRLFVCLVSVIGIFALQLFHCARRTRSVRARYAWLTVPVQVILAFLPVVLYHLVWGSFSAFPAASTLLLLPAPESWTVFGAIVGGTIAAVIGTSQTYSSATYIVISGILTALIVVALVRLADLVASLHAARAERARLAVEEERLRFARDLHDLLGGSFSAILLKGQLAQSMLPDRPEQAREQLDTLLRLSRQALTDVRSTARSYRDLSVAVEASAARTVLAAAEIEASVLVSAGRLPRELDTVLATAIREGVTNLLQHSAARRCQIEATRDGANVRLMIRNDGVRPAPNADDGAGLSALAARLAGVGGTLTTARSGEWFQVVATAPLDGAVPATPEIGAVVAPAVY